MKAPYNKRSKRMQEADKALLDDNTPYTTFLPPMSEGFYMGYKPAPGILSDGNQKPGEWLENFAKHIRAQGEEVGYSIPDVLASEQQLRRLSRLPREMAMRHQEMVDYRAVLTLLLLWDHIATDVAAPVLSLESLRQRPEQGGFSQAVYAALSADRAAEGLKVIALSRPGSENPEKTPLCLLSKAMVIMPAADLADLSGLLPPAVGWYDRQRKRFNDPCPYLDEAMCALLIPRLRFLQSLNESPSAGSLLYSPEAQLCGLIERLIEDVLACRQAWRSRIEAGEPEAEAELRTRVLAVYGLNERENGLIIEERTIGGAERLYRTNPLLRLVTPEDAALPQESTAEGTSLYLLDGVPFARRSGVWLLEPTQAAAEGEALQRAAAEIALLDSYDADWRSRMAAMLTELAQDVKGRTGAAPQLGALLNRWREEYLSYAAPSDREMTLHYPNDTASASLAQLMADMLGAEAADCVQKPFSDCLLLIEGAEAPPLGGTMGAYMVEDGCYYVPPVSMEMAAWLQRLGERENGAAPGLEAFSCRLVEDGRALETGFTVKSRTESDGAPVKVRFVRRYKISTLPEAGAAFVLPAASLPCVTVWPNVRLSAGRWRRYYVHAHQPEAVDIWALAATGWVQGVKHSAVDRGARRQNRRRDWHTVCTERFPAYVALRRGGLCLGVLINDQPRRMLRRETDAVVAMDFGSIATTVMLRQGDKVQAAALPEELHQPLLMADAAQQRFLVDELIPKDAITAGKPGDSTYYSVMDMFTDEPEKWLDPLLDGHIYYPANLSALLHKGEDTLYYDMKWSEEAYALRCLRLFLKQVMLQASLSARLWGSEALSWRVSMPGALPLHRQEAYLDMVRGLAQELAKECGMPLSGGCPPVLYAVENQADGLYFRSRNEVNVRSGYLNMDIGGGTADLSLWLRGAVHATAECSLLLGCRQMLFSSIVEGHVEDFEGDFAASPIVQQAREIGGGIRQQGTMTRKRQKSMFLMDDFFAGCAAEIRDVMAAARAQGKITYVESLLLFNIGFLFHLAGLLLECAYQDEELRPLLPRRMELCIAGNGGQLLKAFTPEQTAALCRFALAALCPEHPVSAMLTVQSADPKREVALGLLHDDDGLQSTLQSVNRWNGTFPGTEGEPAKDETLAAYLLRFYQAFPQAANRLLSGVYETDVRGETRLTPTAKMELDTILWNERDNAPGDDFAMWVRCFAGLKRLWHV